MQDITALFFDILLNEMIVLLVNRGKIKEEVVYEYLYFTGRYFDGMSFQQGCLNLGNLAIFVETQLADFNKHIICEIGAGRHNHRKLGGLEWSNIRMLRAIHSGFMGYESSDADCRDPTLFPRSENAKRAPADRAMCLLRFEANGRWLIEDPVWQVVHSCLIAKELYKFDYRGVFFKS
jgi:hypothetical protein